MASLNPGDAFGLTRFQWREIRRREKDGRRQQKLPEVLYVPANREVLKMDAGASVWRTEVSGLANPTWSPPEFCDKFRPIGYYWVSFWSALDEVCHWDGRHWRSTGDEREWVSRELDRVWEKAIVRQR